MTDDENDDRRGAGGRTVVVVLYVAIVAFTGGVGYLLNVLGIATESPKYLGLVPFPATPLGLAAYGALTLATALGIPLLLVIAVSRFTDTTTVE